MPTKEQTRAVKLQADGAYQELRRFFVAYNERYVPRHTVSVGKHPLDMLPIIEGMGVSKARNGLRQAINDIIEMSEHWDQERVAAFDAELSQQDIVTLTEMRRHFSRSYRKMLRRGRIVSDTEYHQARNAMGLKNLPEEEAQKLQAMVDNYEEQAK